MKLVNDSSLETSRLYLIPLTYDQLLKYTNINYALELELGLLPRERSLTDEFKLTLDNYLLPYIRENPQFILFATIWIMIHKEMNIIIGDIGYNAAPSEKGVIEVGYSTYPGFMNCGFMTEALTSLTKWAFEQPNVFIIIAQTDKDNLSSHKVLSKTKFEPFAEADKFYWWRLDKYKEEIN